MKKPKISLDKDKIQAFFLNHVEKMLLVVVLGLMVLLVWRGFSLPKLDVGKQSPQALVGEADRAKQYVNDPERWIREVKDDRQAQVAINIVKEVERTALAKTDPLAYLFLNSLYRPDFPKLSPRKDPDLYPPTHLVVRPVVGPLASYLKPSEVSNYVDPLYPPDADQNDPIKRMEKMKKLEREKKKAATATSGEYGDEGGMPGGGTRGKRTTRGKRQTGGEEGSADGGYGGTAGEGAMAGAYGEGGGYGGFGGLTGVYPEAGSLLGGYIPQQPDATVARNVASVTVMALVPIQKQTEEYEKKFTEAMDYDPRRDVPWYLDFRIQRADVTDIDPDTEADKLPWKNMPSPQSMMMEVMGDEMNPNAVGLYAGAPMDVLDPTYLDFGVLTHPAPPYLNRDIWDLLTHPDVPLATIGMAYGETAPGTAPAATPEGATPTDEAPSRPAMRFPGMMSGGTGEEGGYGTGGGGYGAGGYGAGGYGAGSAGGGYGGMRGGYGGMAGGEGGGGYGAGGYGAGGYGGMRGSAEDGGYGSEYGSGMMVYTPPKYKLIRFTDVHVERGRKYRYRVRLYVHDPNHPMYGVPAPSAASLEGEVQKRLRELDAADAKKPKDKTTGLPDRTYWRLTDWSEPSPVAELPPTARVLAVKARPAPPGKVNVVLNGQQRTVEVPNGEPLASAVAVVFDPSKAADVPAENERVYRGSVLNFTAEKVKVIHPVTKAIVDLSENNKVKYDVHTNALVADIMGGDPIKAVSASSGSQALTALGEMLVVDAAGHLHVQNEADDIDLVRRFTVPKEDPKAKLNTTTDGSGLEGGAQGDTPRRGRRNMSDF